MRQVPSTIPDEPARPRSVAARASTLGLVMTDQSAAAAAPETELASLGGVRPLARRRLPHDVADQLLDLVAASSGSEIALPAERKLCEQLGVSRNVLREALAALTQSGILETRGKLRIAHVARARANRIARLPAAGERDADPVLDPMEVRRILEPEVASIAAMRASREAIDEMERYVTLMREAAARSEPVVDYDSAFHVSIARATGNQTLVALVQALNDTLRESRDLS